MSCSRGHSGMRDRKYCSSCSSERKPVLPVSNSMSWSCCGWRARGGRRGGGSGRGRGSNRVAVFFLTPNLRQAAGGREGQCGGRLPAPSQPQRSPSSRNASPPLRATAHSALPPAPTPTMASRAVSSMRPGGLPWAPAKEVRISQPALYTVVTYTLFSHTHPGHRATAPDAPRRATAPAAPAR